MIETRQEQRRREAAERRIERAERGDEGQLKKLEREGYTHTREYRRLKKKLNPDIGTRP